MTPSLIPELDVSDLGLSLATYVGVLGFQVRASRPEEQFAYLVREDAHLMLEEAVGRGRRFRTAELVRPFGRGLNLQIQVSDVDALWTAVLKAEMTVVVAMEERWYRQGASELGNRQFVVADPDGYLLRFFTSLGERAAEPVFQAAARA